MASTDHNGIKSNYWLASRRYAVESDTKWLFFARVILINGDYHHDGLYSYQSGIKEFSHGNPIRPIITLRSDAEIKSGDGKSASTAYELS